MRTSDFDFDLPEDRIALEPARPRDRARLLHVRQNGLDDRIVRDLPSLLLPGDLLVLNDTKVIPAQLFGMRVARDSGSASGDVAVEATLIKRLDSARWRALARPGKRLKVGDRIVFAARDFLSSPRRLFAPPLAQRPPPLAPARGGVGGEQRKESDGRRNAPQAESLPGARSEVPAAEFGAPLPPYPPSRRGEGGRLRGEGGSRNLKCESELAAIVEAKEADGAVILAFETDGDMLRKLSEIGAPPLPPYIARKRALSETDAADYQTIYANEEGSVAAPTAGLHFTDDLFRALDARGVGHIAVTLHVGAGTFLPVATEEVHDHVMHSEWGEIGAAEAAAVNAAKARGGRIVAVGTTSLRLLESAADETGAVRSFVGETAIFITPGYRFRAVDGLMTNFHLPRSTLFMLVSAFAGAERMKRAYAHAVSAGYRFYSYGDASLLERATP